MNNSPLYLLTMKCTASPIIIFFLLTFCFVPSIARDWQAISPLSSYSYKVALPLGETSVEKLYHKDNTVIGGNVNQQGAVYKGQIGDKRMPGVYTASMSRLKSTRTTLLNEAYSTNRTNTRKTYSPFSNNSYAVQPMDFPPRPLNRYSVTVMPVTKQVALTAPFSNTTSPVLYALGDNDDDDDWNPGGTGDFDNPGDVGQAPLADAILFLCLLALLYAVSKYFHPKQSTTEK